jgi:hypothetical protein
MSTNLSDSQKKEIIDYLKSHVNTDIQSLFDAQDFIIKKYGCSRDDITVIVCENHLKVWKEYVNSDKWKEYSKRIKIKRCNWYCKEHGEQCMHPKGHIGLHTGECFCSGAKGYGETFPDYKETKGFRKK